MGCASTKSSTPAHRGIQVKLANNASNTLLSRGGADRTSPKPLLKRPKFIKAEVVDGANELDISEFEQDMAAHGMEAATLPALMPSGIGKAATLPALMPSGIGKASKRDNVAAPQGWEEEAIRFAHEGIRLLMQELWDAIYVMDPLPAWKWQNLENWYQEYFYDVVRHHHEAQQQIYLPWIQTRVSVPTKITFDHTDLLQAMEELRDMIRAGSVIAVAERADHLNQLRTRLMAFLADMLEHMAEEEEIIPCLLREAGFTQKEEYLVVGRIIQSRELDGNKRKTQRP